MQSVANKVKGGRKGRKTNKPPRGPRTRGQIALATLKWGAIVGVALGAIGAASVALMFWIYGSDPKLPSIQKLGDYDPLEVSRIYSSGGEVVGELYEQRRTFVPLDEVPEKVVQAFISAEDAKFFEHEGIDYVGMVRAALVNLRSGEKRQGASTITQQVVKTFLLSPERTFKRKIQEIILARRLEGALDKQDILALYLNQIYLGHGRYGVEEAARFYFGKSVREVNLGEAAMLAGLPQAPENISPKKPDNAPRAKARQRYVLSQMVHRGFIAEAEAKTWIDRPIEVVGDPHPAMGDAPEWVEIVRRELAERHGEDRIDHIGAEVRTTVDLEIQRLAREALRRGLRAVDERQHYGRAYRTVDKDQIELALAKLEKRLPDGGPKPGERYPALVVEVHDDPQELLVDLGGHRASVVLGTDRDERYNPDGVLPKKRFEVGDMVGVVLPRGGSPEDGREPTLSDSEVVLAAGPQGAVVVMKPDTREVLAVVGGYGARAGDFNRAIQAERQPGSTFKPFVYAAAIDSGDFTPASIVNDAPEVYNLWKPQNYEAGEFAGPVRLRHALAKSINTVAIRVMHDIGPDRVAELARWMGIESDLPEELSLALGSGVVTPLGLTNAYATIAAGGMVSEPRFITEVDGEAVEDPEVEEALRPEVAYVVADMLRSVVTSGTGFKASRLDVHVAGKTGTSNDSRDAWFMGMSPSFVVGVWVGFDNNRPIGGRETGGRAALPVFVDVMKELGKRERHDQFERPPGVVEARIDKKTGLLAAEGAPEDSTLTEVFVEGTAPTETAPAPGEVDAASFVLDQYDDYGAGYGSGGQAGDAGPAPRDESAPSP